MPGLMRMRICPTGKEDVFMFHRVRVEYEISLPFSPLCTPAHDCLWGAPENVPASNHVGRLLHNVDSTWPRRLTSGANGRAGNHSHWIFTSTVANIEHLELFGRPLLYNTSHQSHGASMPVVARHIKMNSTDFQYDTVVRDCKVKPLFFAALIQGLASLSSLPL